MSVSVSEIRFEVASVFPTLISNKLTATLKISGNLFVDNMRAYLANGGEIVRATNVWRYLSTEVYATFNTESLDGSYSLSLFDDKYGRSSEMTNAVLLSRVVTPGKLLLDMVTPGALRVGTKTIIQVKVGNTGNSDIKCPLILFMTNGNSKLLSTESDIGTSPVESVAFFPLKRNHPPSVLPPKSLWCFPLKFFQTLIPWEKSSFGWE